MRHIQKFLRKPSLHQQQKIEPKGFLLGVLKTLRKFLLYGFTETPSCVCVYVQRHLFLGIESCLGVSQDTGSFHSCSEIDYSKKHPIYSLNLVY